MSMKWIEVIMPQLAESLVSATIAKWLKKPGDRVEQYEPICEVITDKVNAEIPSTVDGIMGDLFVEEGTTIAVGEAICRMQVAASDEEAAEQVTHASQQQNGDHVHVQQSGNYVPTAGAASTTGHDPNQPMRNRYSPAVQSLAAEHGLNLQSIQGTGAGGRITRKDVLAVIAQGGNAGVTSAQSSTVAGQQASSGVPSGSPFSGLNRGNVDLVASTGETVPAADAGVPVRHSGIHLTESPKIPQIEVEGGGQGRSEYFIDVTPVRNAIARNMRQSVSEIPHAWTMIEVDVTNLVMLRNKLKDEFKRKEGINLTYLSFMMKGVVNAIKDYPIMNSVWAVDKIIVKRDINLSMAVGTEDSVLTPVIKHADQRNIAGLAREIDELARKTREGTLKLDHMQGGTFTVNNTGSFGSILSQPIINYPQAAILTFESIVKKPVVINDMIAVRSMANLCLSLDHRILDGVISGRFLQRVKENLEGYTMESKVY
ncbi:MULTISPECIES: dihydrolipoamide acetyltransferase family protein [unclassified Paenibacillus]|uniref:dihydrolipoamide acetyltransferase family protein n=1 Tax=unclassified Paenibacillus TaxID=185978 RepID=UPI0009A7E4FB|nr:MULTISPECIES: dihydrolipoamide acetyltransferase family protein [unclassified Paenibacillus]SLJ91726.1 2-oxoisovalerate dehydrogenase E2 component (dihydrolipoyl transacylase) [Paenibacillus sp. RU5A]SOC58753.1 2-oxoisovalerate dehydrogenase E2 component (dihydrolipoyl transacylase) [Paenibacillus sp. RU26A]SOC67805.1 2-oxoisovalerate dehydrogenase E2 component (dihydrolipoyl transacylase) [Paenibacillus sp. RU5M]